jgi:LPXTG-motif cell wall-anchored protein
VLEGKKLTLYLDRFATNEPVADAKVEVESGVIKAVATQIAAGVYSLPGESFAKPGKYPLAISVQAGDASDLLTLALDLPQPVAGAAPVNSWNNWVVAGAAGALLLAGAALAAVRRRKSTNQRGN